MWSAFNPLNFDYFLVADLEATCSRDDSVPRDEMEIIEIGAVMYDRRSMSVVSEFNTLVKPTRNPVLSEFCKELTTITQNKVCEAPVFTEAFGSFVEWYESFSPLENTTLLSSWGNFDKNQFLRDCAFHGVKYPFGVRHLNIKEYFSWAHNRKRQQGIIKALCSIGMSFEGTHHRGIDDARNAARLLENAIAKSMLD
jgi:inhibitor of KinA sporulation pathway (predicted exonuclease)